MSERRCGCGCGAALHGRKSQRFVSESHRARAHRAKKAAEGQVTGAAATRVDAGDDAGQPAPSNGSMGRVRGGLEVWLNTPEEVFLNWHYEHCVEPHTARRVFDEFTTANEEAKEIQRQRDEEFQRELDAENERLRAEAAERMALQRQRTIPGGIAVTKPGTPEPSWRTTNERLRRTRRRSSQVGRRRVARPRLRRRGRRRVPALGERDSQGADRVARPRPASWFATAGRPRSEAGAARFVGQAGPRAWWGKTSCRGQRQPDNGRQDDGSLIGTALRSPGKPKSRSATSL